MADKMAEIIKKASEAAKHAPEHLQEAAFQKAFDALMADDGVPDPPSGRSGKRKSVRKKAAHTTKDDARTLEELDRTKHSEISHDGKLLDNCLRLLRAAKDDLGIDGLTGSEIARVLTEKFRVKTVQQSVSRSLNGAGQYVDRRTDGQKVLFRIMQSGEDYLDAGPSEKGSERQRQSHKSGRKVKKKKKAALRKKSKKKSAQERQSGKKGSRRSAGPGAYLKQLLQDGFFDSPKTIAGVASQLKDNYGVSFKINELSTPLLRFLRSKELSRKKNSAEQYEYKKR